jgi:hypothetical protein
MRIRDTYVFFATLLHLNYSHIVSSYEKLQFRRSQDSARSSGLPSVDEILSSPYFFVLSTGRCGTALLTNILSHSHRLRVEHAPKPELEYVSSVVHRNGISEEAQKLAVLAARFDLFFVDTFLRGRIYVETNNRITFFAPALATLLPNAKFIHLVRDPADYVRSGMRRGYYQEGHVQHQRLDGSNLPAWRSYSRLEKIAWEWNEINRMTEEFKAQVDRNRVLTINSEALYSDPTITFTVFDFLAICNPFSGAKGSTSLAKLLSKPLNKQKRGYFPKYSQWEDSDKAAFLRIVTLASRYGYSYE